MTSETFRREYFCVLKSSRESIFAFSFFLPKWDRYIYKNLLHHSPTPTRRRRDSHSLFCYPRLGGILSSHATPTSRYYFKYYALQELIKILLFFNNMIVMYGVPACCKGNTDLNELTKKREISNWIIILKYSHISNCWRALHGQWDLSSSFSWNF